MLYASDGTRLAVMRVRGELFEKFFVFTHIILFNGSIYIPKIGVLAPLYLIFTRCIYICMPTCMHVKY